MFKISVKMDGETIDEQIEQMQQQMRIGLRAVAEKVPTHITDHLRIGQGPGGDPQPPLDPDTIEQKQRANLRAPFTPGVATGVLTDPTLWLVRDDGHAYLISPPVQRLRAIEHLENAGYEIIAVPAETEQDFDDLIERVLGGRGE